jgi:phosphate starvation-inducible protein PhoH
MVTGDPGQVDLKKNHFRTKEALLVLKDIEGIGSYIWMIKTL